MEINIFFPSNANTNWLNFVNHNFYRWSIVEQKLVGLLLVSLRCVGHLSLRIAYKWVQFPNLPAHGKQARVSEGTSHY
jgi:hypothetical protein